MVIRPAAPNAFQRPRWREEGARRSSAGRGGRTRARRGKSRVVASDPSVLSLIGSLGEANAMCRIGLGGGLVRTSTSRRSHRRTRARAPPPRCLPLMTCDWKGKRRAWRIEDLRASNDPGWLGNRPVSTANPPARCAPGEAAAGGDRDSAVALGSR